MSSNATVSLSVDAFEPTEMYFLLRDSVLPRPIAWVSSISERGETNLAPFSFFTVCCPYPPVLGFSCGPRGDNHAAKERVPKDTYLNIKATREFVVNVVPEGLFDPMVETSTDYPHGQSEFAATGLIEASSTTVRPPRVAGAPVAYECKLYDIVDIGMNVWIMGSVQHVHIAENVYQGRKGPQNHRIDLFETNATRPMGRLGRANYVRIREIEAKLRKDGPNG